MSKHRSRNTSFPVSTRWSVEIDYRQKLSDAQKSYLDVFNESWASTNCDPNLTPQQKREHYNNNYKKRTDAMGSVLDPETCADRKSQNINSHEDTLIAILDSKPPRHSWLKTEIIEAASAYKTLEDFRRGNLKAYRAMCYRKLTKECKAVLKK